MPASSRRLRLCLKDLYHQDIVEMIERETRSFELREIVEPGDPDFPAAYKMLWDAFGADGEIEQRDDIERFLRESAFDPTPNGTYIRFFLIVARDRDGTILGVRDGSILVNPNYAPDLCVVYLAHLYMLPKARGTVLSYELRISPVEIAIEFLKQLHQRGLITLPAPEHPGRYFGMNVTLAAEMEYYWPSDPVSWQRSLFYGRGGFDAINPRHVPYMQPDFRDRAGARVTGSQPIPLMILVRRMGRERQATMPIEEASAIARLLYDDFACHWKPEELESSLQRVLDGLDVRAKRKSFVELLPLPTGPKDLNRIRPLYRFTAYQRYYKGATPAVDALLNCPDRQLLRNPAYLDFELRKLAAHLEARKRYIYPTRERGLPGDGYSDPAIDPGG